MTYGQITQTEAQTRGLLTGAPTITGADGRTRYYHTATRLFWIDPTDMPLTPAVPGWTFGLPPGA